MESQWCRFHCPAFNCVIKLHRIDNEWLVVEGPAVTHRWRGKDVQDMLKWAREKWGEAKLEEAI